MASDMFSSGLTIRDLLTMLVGAWRTLQMTAVAGLAATILGMLLGLLKLKGGPIGRSLIDGVTDLMRSIPLLVLVTLIYSGFAVLRIPLSVFGAGSLALALFGAGYVAEVTRGAVKAIPMPLRRGARGLGMTPTQEFRYIVVPLAVRQGFPAWLGIMLGIVKDTSVVAVIGYVELLKTTQIIVVRTQDPLPPLALAALFYFLICFPLSLAGRRLENILNKGSAR